MGTPGSLHSQKTILGIEPRPAISKGIPLHTVLSLWPLKVSKLFLNYFYFKLFTNQDSNLFNLIVNMGAGEIAQQ